MQGRNHGVVPGAGGENMLATGQNKTSSMLALTGGVTVSPTKPTGQFEMEDKECHSLLSITPSSGVSISPLEVSSQGLLSRSPASQRGLRISGNGGGGGGGYYFCWHTNKWGGLLFIILAFVAVYLFGWERGYTSLDGKSLQQYAKGPSHLYPKVEIPGYEDIIYGHVHIAKSAGSSLVDLLVSKYERVCSNKQNPRFFQDDEKIMTNCSELKGHNKGKGLHLKHLEDYVNYGNDTGECDYVSSEYGSKFWHDVKWSKPMELHVPCKDSLNLLMSNCFWPRGGGGARRVNPPPGWKCSPKKTTDTAIEHQIKNCFGANNRLTRRFDKKLLRTLETTNITLKCFDVKDTFDAYQDYMDQRLKHRNRQIKIPDCRPRMRNKETECIWKDLVLMRRVERILRKEFFYFRYCDMCLNSTDNLIPKK